MKIGILGTGVVGVALGTGWAKEGHDVMFSSRDPQSEKIQTLIGAIGEHAQAGTAAETVAFGDVIAVAIGWDNLPEVLRSVSDWSGKILIDATNRFGPAPDGSVGSAAEDIAHITGAAVVKAFNSIGAENMDHPHFGDQIPTMFIAGDDTNAKATVTELTEALGFEVVDAGPLSNAVLLEDLVKLWLALARGSYGRRIAFKLLRGEK